VIDGEGADGVAQCCDRSRLNYISESMSDVGLSDVATDGHPFVTVLAGPSD